MALSRRDFLVTAGAGSAGLLSGYLITGRGREEEVASSTTPWQVPAGTPPADGIVHIGSNENARGPAPSVYASLRDNLTMRIGRGYPPDHTGALVDAVAAQFGVPRENVVVGTGSGPILAGAARAFLTADRGLVTASPTYETTEGMARKMGVPIKALPVDGRLGLDLTAMADAATGAGLVFLCNPNNPTGTAHKASDVEAFVRQVKTRSPQTAILIDEAYIEYTPDPEVKTAAALALEYPGVFINRTFSKAHGMAGLRIGYAVGQPETVAAINDAWHLGSMNTLSAAAAIASLNDTAHMEEEKVENARVRDYTVNALRGMGYTVADSHTNHLFVETGRPAKWFRDQCVERGFRVGRDFPPFQETHARISLGTYEEMQGAVEVFREVLST